MPAGIHPANPGSTRGVTSPLASRSKTVLIDDKGGNSMSALASPAVANVKASALSRRLPTKESRMVVQMSPAAEARDGHPANSAKPVCP